MLVLVVLAALAPSCTSAGRHSQPSTSPTNGPTSAATSPSTSRASSTTTGPPRNRPMTVVARLTAAVVPSPRYRTMGAAIDDSMYLLGGLDASGTSSSDIYRIDPVTGQTIVAGHLAVATHGGAAVSLGDRVLVLGGADVSPDNLVQSFDPSTGTTMIIGYMPASRADLVAAVVSGRVIVLGGFTGSQYLKDIWSSPDGRSFSVVGRLAQVERYPAIAVLGTTIYLFGGLLAGGEYDGAYSTTIQSFDVATGRSAVIGQLATPLAHARAATVAGQVLVFGGWTPGGASSAILRFDPTKRSVTTVATLPEAVADEAIATVGDIAYFASGLGAGQRPLDAIGTLTAASS